MKLDMDKIIFESREEISLLQDVLEIAIASKNLTESEKEIATKTSGLLESMYISW